MSIADFLVRQRQVWLPTIWGWLLLLLAAAGALLIVVPRLHGFLAPDEPAMGAGSRGARTLVVEGFLNESDLDQAIAAFRRGHYERVLTTGGPIDSWSEYPSHAARAAGYLVAHGLESTTVTAVPGPASVRDRTFQSAVALRDWAQRSDARLDAIDLFSRGVHARRSRTMYRMALGDGVEVGVLASRPADYDAQHWWRSSEGTKLVVGELLGLVWTSCCFWPEAPGANKEAQGCAGLTRAALRAGRSGAAFRRVHSLQLSRWRPVSALTCTRCEATAP